MLTCNTAGVRELQNVNCAYRRLEVVVAHSINSAGEQQL